MPGTYSLILCDPCWKYDNQQQNDPKRGGITYPVLSMDNLAAIPINKAASTDALLVCWVTFPKLMDGFYEHKGPLDVIRAWGFRPVTTLFVWVKLNRRAHIKPYGALDFGSNVANDEYIMMNDLYSGLGRYTNSNVEIAIIARKGKGIPRLAKNVKQLIIAPIRAHSEKPQVQYDRLYDLYGDVPRIELFARKQNPPPIGWDATGLDYDGLDIRDWIKQY